MDKFLARITAFVSKNINFRIIFIIGCGRSGTHWLGHTLAAHPDIYVSIEKPTIFNLVTSIALNPRKKKRLLPKLIRQYKYEYHLVRPPIYADKSHPNIYLVILFPSISFLEFF